MEVKEDAEDSILKELRVCFFFYKKKRNNTLFANLINSEDTNH